MNILVIAPHADDEILGVGGTIARYIAQGDQVYVCITAKGFKPFFSKELVGIVKKEALEAHRFLGIKKTFFLNFPATMLERVNRSELNHKLLQVIEEVKPEIVFIPHFGDIQKDHEVIAKLSMVALRPKNIWNVRAIYAYETLSETEWNIPHASNSFLPTVYIDISDYMEIKLEAMSMYRSQLSNFPSARSLENLEALAKYRGATVHVCAAESFALIRQII